MAHMISPYEEQKNPATDKGQPALTAIEIRFPETFRARAWHVIDELGSTILLYVYKGKFIATSDRRRLDEEDIQWQGETLEELEVWLEARAEEMDKDEPGWEEPYLEHKIKFNPQDQQSLIDLMDQYGNSTSMYPGINENGEAIHISIFREKIVVMTFQGNGWARKNFYYRDGSREETFEGKWNAH